MNEQTQTMSNKDGWIYAVLLVFGGFLGVHRFYIGKIGMGIAYLLTAGFLGVGVVIDAIVLLSDGVKDNECATLHTEKSAKVFMVMLVVAALFYVTVLSIVVSGAVTMMGRRGVPEYITHSIANRLGIEEYDAAEVRQFIDTLSATGEVDITLVVKYAADIDAEIMNALVAGLLDADEVQRIEQRLRGADHTEAERYLRDDGAKIGGEIGAVLREVDHAELATLTTTLLRRFDPAVIEGYVSGIDSAALETMLQAVDPMLLRQFLSQMDSMLLEEYLRGFDDRLMDRYFKT